MNRRDILKAVGLAAAGTALLPFDSLAKAASQQLNNFQNESFKDVLSSRRKLGKLLEVSAIGLGVQNMSRTYQTTIPNRSEMHNIIRKAFDNDVTLFDAAEAYGPFEVEKILGEAVSSFRDKIVIETKFGWNIDQKTGQRLPGLNSKPEHIKMVVEGMLKRLRTDRIDLLYQHRVDPEVPIEDVVGTIKDLMKEGKVLNYGLSEPGVETVRRAHAIHPVTAIQNEYSLLWRGPEETILPLCEELGIGFVPWSPLGVGFLTGAIDANTGFAPGDIRGRESRFSKENLPNNLALIEVLQKWATKKNATPGQISLAWLLAQKPWIVPIPGTTQMAHMLENLKAEQVKFTANELKQFNTEVDAVKILGERLPANVLQFSNVEAPLKKNN
ncbi:General stress protein 69 [Chryseobacterium sp. MOF25P]|uniref:aldo/keto reductase n=1 Tax=unclassified Chryseobacterium TaxID=2593645 RepID=UPI000805FB28|nr:MULTISPECIES: aldo/keto reductase [unclassified Chryseobacterium]OBW40731.1 General stress protein 69 [Chryseobacterium sp. MOF25P]OBW47025.1 General stress protein 69 [Chryseobacterium sp. BGARF1]